MLSASSTLPFLNNEEAFRKSEPPAHDDWKPEGSTLISSVQKTFVKTALREIKLEMKKLSGDSSELFFNTNEINQNSMREVYEFQMIL